LAAGSEVELRVQSGSIVVQPVKRKRHKLNNLLRRVTTNNRHAATETGAAIGKEVW
jgi:antitoxin component of MazEF toxin-antitoxin module